MKKISVTKYKSIEQKASSYFRKHKIACGSMLGIIKPLLSFELDHNDCVFLQDGDGYCLSWESKRSATNTPVDAIIEEFNSLGRLLNENDMLRISI